MSALLQEFLFNAIFNDCGLSQLIDKKHGNRVSTVGYSFSDIIRNYANIIFSGGNCAEDIQTHLGKYLKAIPDNNVPSADTMLRGIKQLTTENQVIATCKYDAKYTYKQTRGYLPGVASIDDKIVFQRIFSGS